MEPETMRCRLRRLVTEKELIDFLGISRWIIRNLIQKGLPHIGLGKGVRVYHEESVVMWLLSKEEGDRSIVNLKQHRTKSSAAEINQD